MRPMSILALALFILVGTAARALAASAVLYSAALGTAESFGTIQQNYYASVVNLEAHPVTATISFCNTTGACDPGDDCQQVVLQAQEGCLSRFAPLSNLGIGGFHYVRIDLTSQTGSSILARGLLHANIAILGEASNTVFDAIVEAH